MLNKDTTNQNQKTIFVNTKSMRSLFNKNLFSCIKTASIIVCDKESYLELWKNKQPKQNIIIFEINSENYVLPKELKEFQNPFLPSFQLIQKIVESDESFQNKFLLTSAKTLLKHLKKLKLKKDNSRELTYNEFIYFLQNFCFDTNINTKSKTNLKTKTNSDTNTNSDTTNDQDDLNQDDLNQDFLQNFLNSSFIEVNDIANKSFIIKTDNDLLFGNSNGHQLYIELVLKRFNLRIFKQHCIKMVYGKPQPSTNDYDISCISQKTVSKKLGLTPSRIQQVTKDDKKIFKFIELTKDEYNYIKHFEPEFPLYEIKNTKKDFVKPNTKTKPKTVNQDTNPEMKLFSRYFRVLGTKLLTSYNYKSIIKGELKGKEKPQINRLNKLYRPRKTKTDTNTNSKLRNNFLPNGRSSSKEITNLFAPKLGKMILTSFKKTMDGELIYKSGCLEEDEYEYSMKLSSSERNVYQIIAKNYKNALIKLDTRVRIDTTTDFLMSNYDFSDFDFTQTDPNDLILNKSNKPNETNSDTNSNLNLTQNKTYCKGKGFKDFKDFKGSNNFKTEKPKSITILYLMVQKLFDKALLKTTNTSNTTQTDKADKTKILLENRRLFKYYLSQDLKEKKNYDLFNSFNQKMYKNIFKENEILDN